MKADEECLVGFIGAKGLAHRRTSLRFTPIIPVYACLKLLLGHTPRYLAVSLDAAEKFLPSSFDFLLPTFMSVNRFDVPDALVIPLGAIPLNGCPDTLPCLPSGLE